MTPRAVVLVLACVSACVGHCAARYWGASLGPLSRLQHGVSGHVYAVDARTLYIKDFHYDGQGPAAYFIVGTTATPSTGGTRLRDERGGAGPLRAYRGEGVTLSLPEGKTLKDFRYLSVWCEEYSVNFGHVSIPAAAEGPRAARLGALRGVHGVRSDPVLVVDAQTILVPNFSYDGEAPDAKFWVGRGPKPSPQGVRIPDENGKEAPLRKYDRKTIVLTLPGELTVFDIGHFGVWCEAFTVDFGHVEIPAALVANVPPSLKMLGVSPQSKLNCEVLMDELAFEVRWAVAGDSIVLQLVAKIEDGEYMSFGISGSPERSVMVGSDVAVAWVDKNTLKGYAVDYYLDAKSQCAGVRGSCPDERLGEKTNSIRLLNAALVNGYSIVTFQRPLAAADQLDRAVLTNGSQAIVWALGPLNSRHEVSYHHLFTKGDKLLEFGRPPLWNCPMPEGEADGDGDRPPATEPPRTRKPLPEHTTQLALKPNAVPTPAPVPKSQPWDIPPIQCYEPPDGVFYAQMGPTGGKQGYPAITGHVGWGISWYINGLLIPELTLVRGRRYTFVVEGGSDPNTPAKYHPFYITNDPVGGYFHKSDQEKKGVEIYAGVRRTRSGEVVPLGAGRLCSWAAEPDAAADDFPSFGAYQRALTLVCEEGSPGVVTWTPDRNTPDTVYYQCFTHRHLGWKIHVVDQCDVEPEGAESRSELVAVAAPEDLQPQESLQVETRLPPPNALDQRKSPKIINTKTNYNNFSSQKPEEEVYPSAPEQPVSAGQIRDVIEAVEGLESRLRQRPAPTANRPSYQVHEELESHDQGPMQENFFLPNKTPHTLQSALKPHNRPNPNMRPPFRRPAPSEYHFRRPSPPLAHKKHNYPLQMPNQQKKHYGKPHGNRPPMNHPPSLNVIPLKMMPPLHHHNNAFQQSPKYLPKIPTGPVQGIIMGKPANIPQPTQSQTLSVGRTDLIANQIVKSQITLPSDSVPSSSVQTFVNQPGQIILGKPMDHPIPLDQQMIQTNEHHMQTSTSPDINFNADQNQYEEHIALYKKYEAQDESSTIKSSDLIGEHVETSSLPPAVNTGFKPNTIVIESGFKPIIREPLMDRLGDYEENANRREDTDIEEDYEDSPQTISHNMKPQLSSDKLTESFEPMFIPSPLDTMKPADTVVLPLAVTKEVFPKNHAKEDRPHPVYVKTEGELNALFGKKNMDKDVPSDMVMESDRVSPQYLPPDPKKLAKQPQKLVLNEQTFTTYDGKIVSAATLTKVSDLSVRPKIFSAKLPANTELLLKTPQFGPFKGEIPPLETVSAIKEPHEADTEHSKATRLKLVNKYITENYEDLYQNEFREKEDHEIKLKNKGEEMDDVKETKKREMEEEYYDQDTEKKIILNEEKEVVHEMNDEMDEVMGEEDSAMMEQQRSKRDTVSMGTVPDENINHDHHYHPDKDIIIMSNKSSTLHWSNLLIFIILCHKLF